MKNKFVVLCCCMYLSVLFFGCKRSRVRFTNSGMKYEAHKENPGPKAKNGDFITIDMVYKTENDSVLFDSKKNTMPMRFQLASPPFSGSMEEGISYLAVGDSATFYVSADSMIRKVFSKLAGDEYVRPDFLKTGSFLKFDIKLLRIQSELDAAQEMFRELDQLAASEKASIEKYILDHQIKEQPDANGIYIIKTKKANGAIADSGMVVTINYTGKFLNGEVFNSNNQSTRPYSFVVGKNEVISGWDIAFKQLRQGERATLIIPSLFAYGEEGLRNKVNGTFVIPPNTALLFDVDVLAVQ